jgi:four helix bundle protein
MAIIKSFTDLQVWQRARVYAHEIFLLTMREPFLKDYSLKDQINRAAGGIMDNIAERFDRNGNREFIQFLSIAKGCAAETQSQLFRAFDRQYVSTEEFERFQKESIEIANMIGGLMRYLKTSGIKGSKFQEPLENYSIS